MDVTVATNFLIAMLAITNPVGKVPLWVRVSGDDSEGVRWRLALMVTTTARLILLGALLLGTRVLNLFGIDLASFQIGGGVVILLVGIKMINGTATDFDFDERDDSEDDLQRAKSRFRKVVVPMSMPILAGPGSIST